MENPKLPFRMSPLLFTPLHLHAWGQILEHVSPSKPAFLICVRNQRSSEANIAHAGKMTTKASPLGIGRVTDQPCPSMLHSCDTLTLQLPAN